MSLDVINRNNSLDVVQTNNQGIHRSPVIKKIHKDNLQNFQSKYDKWFHEESPSQYCSLKTRLQPYCLLLGMQDDTALSCALFQQQDHLSSLYFKVTVSYSGDALYPTTSQTCDLADVHLSYVCTRGYEYHERSKQFNLHYETAT